MSSCPEATTDTLLAAIGRGCHSLSTLYIEFDGWAVERKRDANVISAAALVELVRGCGPQLQVLSLAGLPVATPEPGESGRLLASFARACPALTSLNGAGCAWPAAADWAAAGATVLAAEWPSLRCLSLSGAGRSAFHGKATAAQLAAAVGRNLTSLCLEGCPTICDADVMEIVQVLRGGGS